MSRPVRVWPQPRRQRSAHIPPSVRVSLDEADRCFGASAFTACAVMCGRALEAICHDKGQKVMLGKGLQKLKDAGVIDGRLYDWGEALRESRNLGAHPSDVVLSRQDARDLLDFSHAICDYVYVLAAQYDEFLKRKTSARGSGELPSPF